MITEITCTPSLVRLARDRALPSREILRLFVREKIRSCRSTFSSDSKKSHNFNGSLHPAPMRMEALDFPVLRCAPQRASQDSPSCCRGRRPERDAQETGKAIVKLLLSPPDPDVLSCLEKDRVAEKKNRPSKCC